MPLNHSSKYAELTDNQFILIGKLTVEFSNIELLLGIMLGRLSITPSFLSRIYIERMNVNHLIEKIKNAVDIHESKYENEIISKEACDLIKSKLFEIEKIRVLRNKFAHYCWCRETDEKIFGSSYSAKQGKFNKTNNAVTVITNSEIEEVYLTAYKIVDDLDVIVKKLPVLLEDNNLRNKLNYK